MILHGKHMKNKIAICANGWNYDLLFEALDGIKEYAASKDFDSFVFLSYASYSTRVEWMQGELNIYDMIDPNDYDGVIVFSNALNSPTKAVSLCRRIKQSGVPVVSVGMEIDGIPSVCVSNESGMRELVEHLIEQHGVKNAYFIGGTPDHVDSRERLKVTKETFAAHGLELSDKNIGYGRWSNYYTDMIIDEIVDSGKGLPDAFICANDVMAMAACTKLEERGFLAPEDVIVTGFDAIDEAKKFYPAMTTVERNYKEVGKNACKIIFSLIEHEDSSLYEKVESIFSCGESCGCRGKRDYAADRIMYCRQSFRREFDERQLEQNERVIRQWLTDMPSYDILKETLSDHYQRNHQFEGDDFYICINKEYFTDVMTDEKELLAKGRVSEMDALVSIRNGIVESGLKVDAHTIVPGYFKTKEEQHVYFFLPLHDMEHNCGYVVFKDFPGIIRANILYPYMEQLQQSIKLMRTNFRLRMLYDRDQMTGLYNRFGYEGKALPLYEDSLKNKTKLTVMFVDINYMKHINDVYGHLQGDNAIRTVVAAINQNIDKDAIAVRFGGDEFLLIAPDCDEKRALEIKESILFMLDKRSKEKTDPYDISVSIGYVVSDPTSRKGATLQDYIREADNKMYEIKKEMHKQLDRRKGDR